MTSLDNKGKTIKLDDGTTLHYDKLCVATGGKVNIPPIKGVKLENVYTLRTEKDQAIIKEKAAHSKSVVIVGASFIGSESASSLKLKYKDDLAVHLIS